MLRTAQRAPSAEVQSIVEALLHEDSQYDRHENRSTHREHLVRAVAIEVRRPEPAEFTAFSRNISVAGVGLITDQEIVDNSVAVLAIEALDGRVQRIMAECRWCKTYGKNWFISGWQFMAALRNR